MAATRLIAMHPRQGRSVAKSLGERTDYAKNPEKTEKGDLVTTYQCDPFTVDEEFMLQKRQYNQITGKSQHNDVIAYQIRQSFKPGEVTADEANRIGYELALRFRIYQGGAYNGKQTSSPAHLLKGDDQGDPLLQDPYQRCRRQACQPVCQNGERAGC